MDFVRVAGADFVMGLLDDERAGWLGRMPGLYLADEPPQQVHVAPFMLGRTKVTNAQFHAFVKGGGYQNRAFWEEDRDLLEQHQASTAFADGSGKPGPLTFNRGVYPAGTAEHPVGGVSWFEARAFCRFAGYRLPTEAEWELACRGPQRRAYAWGDAFDPQRCLCGQAQSAPVTACPAGNTPEGIAQMWGNGAEWCADRFATPGEDIRFVVRSETSAAGTTSMRATLRNGWRPDQRLPGFGFRCAKDGPG